MQADHAFYIAAGLLPASGVLFYLCRRSIKRLNAMLETPTIACRDLPGLGASTVEVNGIARIDRPLVSDLARAACVAFSSTITEHWTTTETERDSDGKTRTVTRFHTAVRYHNEGRIPFDVFDESGHAHVEPDGAEIELLGQAAGPAPPDSPAFGIFPMHLGGYLTYSESVLPVETQVYVLAQVSERHTLTKHETLDEPFIISPRTEEQLVRSARWGKRIFGTLSAAAMLGSLGLFGYWYELTHGRFPWQ